ncbi:MAG: DUF7684 family protein [Pyrinomonadaceae bacterium]
MSGTSKKIILYSKNGYSKKHDELLNRIIDEKILLFCVLGKDCELWHDIMDELFVGLGEERDFFMITTWHTNETLDEVIEFAKDYDFEGIDNKKIEIITV